MSLLVAYHAPLLVSSLNEAVGKISKEMIMIYPPGIPVIVPGERFTQSVVDEIEYYIENKATILSDWNQTREVSVIDEENWSLADKID